MQRVRLLHLLELRQSRQHILDRIQTIAALVASLVGEIRVVLDEALEIRHQLLNHILHMSMPIVDPYLVLFLDRDVFDFLISAPFIDGDAERHFIRVFLDGEEVVRHGLVCELVDQRGEEVHAAVADVEGSARPVGGVGGWEVGVEFGVQVEFVLHEAREVRAEDAGFVAWGAGPVVADGWVFAEGDADADDLLVLMSASA